MKFIPLRVYTEGEPTFRELADEARDMAAYASSGGAAFEAARHTWRAWQLSQFLRWEYAGSWDLSVFSGASECFVSASRSLWFQPACWLSLESFAAKRILRTFSGGWE